MTYLFVAACGSFWGQEQAHKGGVTAAEAKRVLGQNLQPQASTSGTLHSFDLRLAPKEAGEVGADFDYTRTKNQL